MFNMSALCEVHQIERSEISISTGPTSMCGAIESVWRIGDSEDQCCRIPTQVTTPNEFTNGTVISLFKDDPIKYH